MKIFIDAVTSPDVDRGQAVQVVIIEQLGGAPSGGFLVDARGSEIDPVAVEIEGELIKESRADRVGQVRHPAPGGILEVGSYGWIGVATP